MLFRNRRVVRVIACFLLVQMGGSLLVPTVSLAMSGPSQPEFISYEAPGATDLVNLSTGDFAYSIPVLDVPGPERSFSLPLSYKAGIQLEQEASWVGLGWSLNAGAIARTVNGYADDANGDVSVTNMLKRVADVSTVNYIPVLFSLTEEMYSGKYVGTVDLIGLASLNWNNDGIAGGDVVGIGYQKGQGVTIDPVRLMLAAATIATAGGASVAEKAGSLGIQAFTQPATQMGIGLAAGAFGLGRLGGVASFSNGLTSYTIGDFIEKDTYTILANNTKEHAYGSLYFGQLSQRTIATGTGPTVGVAGGATGKQPEFIATRDCAGTTDSPGTHLDETAADIYQHNGGSNAISVAHDYFSVMGEGVSGSMRPYRLDVGSVAYPWIKTADCDKHLKYMTVPFQDYKVGFRYEGDLSNTYDYHQNGQDIGFQVSADKQSVTITDQRLFAANARIEKARKGLVNPTSGTPQLVQGKHVVWYSNAEIEQMSANPGTSSFLDFNRPTAGAGTANAFRHQLPPSGIGAFAVTGEDGTTYHYSLPVYQFKTYTYSDEKQLATTVGKLGKYTKHEGDPSPSNPHGGYATTWLLTAITSSDYIDRNNSGTVDASDWGGWVKFDYGKFSSRYKWRQPYVGTSYSDITDQITYEGYTQGYRESYYLDKISTRTHTALFVKSVRQDGRGHFDRYSGGFGADGLPHPNDLGIDDHFPASSLRLDEIILVDNSTLAKVQTVDGIRAQNDPVSTPALSNNTAGNATTANCSTCGDDLGQVLDGLDFTTDTRIKQFVEANALKRVHFNYSYDLCRGVPNSFTYQNNQPASLPLMDVANASVNRGGKLTLKSVSFFGPTVNSTPTKIIPDFTFGYEATSQTVERTNPAYSQEKWDAYGMYNPGGVHNTTSHKPDPSAYTAPWTLTKVTSPMGASTTIAYERDQYAHLSEYGNSEIYFTSDGASTLTLAPGQAANLTAALGDVLKAGDKVRVLANLISTCPSTGRSPVGVQVDNVLQIAAVTSNSITLTTSFNIPCGTRSISFGAADSPDGVRVYVPKNIIGGDIRVASITTTEGSSEYKVLYKYRDARGEDYNSTGVLTKEPTFLGRSSRLTNNQFDYPTTPVLYSQVSVLRGPFRNNDENSADSREVYAFFTPTTDMVSEDLKSTITEGFWDPINQNYTGLADLYNNQVKINTGLIGRPQSVRTYNRQGQLELSSDFIYANQVANADGIAGQGNFSEGVLTNEQLSIPTNQVVVSPRDGRGGGAVMPPVTTVINHYQVNRTTKEYVPAVMVGSRSTRNGLSITNSNVLYDFYTGQALETAFTNSLGKVYHARTVPAYTLAGNEGMGAAGDKVGNKNMLAQTGAAYAYVEIAGGPVYSPLNPLNPQTSRVLSAGVQTWQSNWTNYREADANGVYQDVVGQQPVWRQAATYTWQSPVLDTDGSFKDFTPFSWTGTPDKRWLKASETVRYDHYSHALESRDVNGHYAAQKTGYDQTKMTVAGTNARYTELAYSGAEDPISVGSATHFGGEVVAGNGGSLDKQLAHTGFYSYRAAPGQKGFVYRAQIGRDVDAGKSYRVSVWTHATALNGKLYALLNGARVAESSRASATTKKAGEWYLLSLLVTMPSNSTGQTVEIGSINDDATAPANFDDFRIAPLTSTITSTVYDPRSNRTLYSLDNDHLFTYYEYTPTGSLKRVYQETLDGTGSKLSAQKLVKEYDYNYAQLRAPTWVTTAYRCKVDNDGNYTGTEERQVVDANPLNTPATPAKWEDSGGSSACTPPSCPFTDSNIPYRLRNNVWEQARPNGSPIQQSCGGQTCMWVYHWIYNNGDSGGETDSDCSAENCTQFAPQF